MTRLLRERTFLFALLLAAGLFVANVVALPAFVAVDHWDVNLATFAPFAILAMASTPAVMTGSGGLDLSIAPLANLANVVLVVWLLTHPPLDQPWVAIPLVLLLTTGVGVVNGLLVTALRIPPVVGTVGMLLLLLGVNARISPLPVTADAAWVQSLHGNLGPVPWGLLLIAAPLALWAVLRLTPFPTTLALVGGDAATAWSAGVRVGAVRIAAYALGGLFAGVAGLALTTVFLTSDPNIGFQYVLVALAAVAIGGTPIGTGGRGGIVGSVLGAAVIYLLQNLLIVLHVPNAWLQVAYGALLLAGAVLGGAVATGRAPVPGVAR